MRGGASVCMERGISARRRYAALRVARTGALDERGHGGGDHPVPFRTRQLSPPSPDVLRGKPVGGRAAALAQRARTRAPAHRGPRHARGPSRYPAGLPSGPRFRHIEGPASRGAFLVPVSDRRSSLPYRCRFSWPVRPPFWFNRAVPGGAAPSRACLAILFRDIRTG